MSGHCLPLDGAARAARLIPLSLLLALGAAPPAMAQLPRPLPAAVAATAQAAAPVVLGEAGSAAPLSLRAGHVDIRITGHSALVRTTLTYRNDGAVPVEALYTVPLPATLATLQQPAAADAAAFDGCADDDLPYEAAQFAEAGEPIPVYERGSVLLAPGEEVAVTLVRSTELIVRGDRQRLVLPLPTQRGGVFTPQFSADVTIAAERPVHDLASSTHAAEISGVGERSARLAVPAGRVYEGQFLALEYRLGGDDDAAADIAAHGWGGEGRHRAVLAATR